MPSKLTVAQQRALYRALPASRKLAVKRHCQQCQMRGEGLFSILKSIGKTLGYVGKESGPTVLKEIIAPLVIKKYGGKGLTLPGGGRRVAPKKRRKTMPKRYVM